MPGLGPDCGDRMNGAGKGMRPWSGGAGRRVSGHGAQNICQRSEHVRKQGLFGKQNFRVWNFLAGIVSSIKISHGYG